MSLRIAIIDSFLPGEALQIAQSLEQAFGAHVEAHYTLMGFLPIKMDLDVLVVEYDFPLSEPTEEDPNCSKSYERVVAQIPSLSDLDPLYMGGTSTHLINQLRKNGCTIPVIVHTHRSGEVGEEIPKHLFRDKMVRIVKKEPDGFAALHQAIRTLLK